VILKTARAHAAFEGRNAITERDIMLAAELALPHRLKRGTFHDVQGSLSDLGDKVEQFSSEYREGDAVQNATPTNTDSVKKKVSL